MRRMIRRAAWALAAFGAGGWLVSGCGGIMSSQKAEDIVNGVVDEVKEQAQEEFKKKLSDEIGDFFESGDLARTLGIGGDGQAELENSIKNYITSYNADEKRLGEAKQAVEELLKNAEGLSVDQIEEKMSEIFN